MSATAIALLLLTLEPPGEVVGYYVSSLRPGSCRLTALSYLFQGRPDAVIGTDFGYVDRDRRDLETYLKELLEKPATYQLPLSESAAFLASRIYLDHRGERAYLVLTKEDALYGLAPIYKLEGLVPKDKLLLRTLETYYGLVRSREEAGYPWPKPNGKLESIVAKNMDQVVKRLTVVTWIKQSWEAPGVWR